MKILHAFLFFSVKHAGGTVDVIYNLARAQSERGHHVTIYTGDFRFDASYARSLPGVDVSVFRSWLNRGFYVMPGLVGHARNSVRDLDIIHLHCYRSFQNVVLHHFAARYGVPYVMDAHGSLGRFTRKRSIKALFDRVVGRRILLDAARCISETESGRQEYLDAGVEPSRVAVIPLPLPVDDFRRLPPRGRFRRRFGLGHQRVVMFVGRVHWIKGIDFLVRAFAELAERRDDVLLVIVGPDDGYRASLGELIGDLRLSGKVLFTGFLEGADKLEALVDADVVVQTSRYESGARPPFEAVLCGTPIVVSDNSGAGADVRKAHAGYLVTFGDVSDLREKVAYVLDHPEEARQRARRGKEYVERHLAIGTQIQEYEKLYEECLAERKSRALERR